MGQTQPGGIYRVGDKLVDANGQETEDKTDELEETAGLKVEIKIDEVKLPALKKAVKRLGINVTRADGTPPTEDDYRQVLREYQAANTTPTPPPVTPVPVTIVPPAK
jgi:hypothetical protein